VGGCLYRYRLNQGGPHKVTASVNHPLTEAVVVMTNSLIKI
jgi:hypothetical protein